MNRGMAVIIFWVGLALFVGATLLLVKTQNNDAKDAKAIAESSQAQANAASTRSLELQKNQETTTTILLKHQEMLDTLANRFEVIEKLQAARGSAPMRIDPIDIRLHNIPTPRKPRVPKDQVATKVIKSMRAKLSVVRQ